MGIIGRLCQFTGLILPPLFSHRLVPFFGSFMAVESSLVWVIYIALGSVFALFLNMDRLTHAWPDRIETGGALLLVVFCVFLCASPVPSHRPSADTDSPSRGRAVERSGRHHSLLHPRRCRLPLQLRCLCWVTESERCLREHHAAPTLRTCQACRADGGAFGVTSSAPSAPQPARRLSLLPSVTRGPLQSQPRYARPCPLDDIVRCQCAVGPASSCPPTSTYCHQPCFNCLCCGRLPAAA